jgi:hypothetical protein
LGSAGGKGIRAYHGSPYDFDRFDLSKIGSGEGAQAYGHGLYFAEHEPTAQSYKNMMKTTDMDWPVALEGGGESKLPAWVARGIQSSPTRLDEIRADFANRVKEMTAENHWNTAGVQNILDTIDAYKGGKAQINKPGRMYEVTINGHPDEFLDFDKPLSEQSELVQDAAKKLRPRLDLTQETGANLYDRIRPSGLSRQAEAAQTLRDAGIKGIKYLDQGSRNLNVQILSPAETTHGQWVVKHIPNGDVLYRGADEAAARAAYDAAPKPTSNYVVFDDKLIDIVRKYGLAGLLGAGAYHFKTSGNHDNPHVPGPI